MELQSFENEGIVDPSASADVKHLLQFAFSKERRTHYFFASDEGCRPSASGNRLPS